MIRKALLVELKFGQNYLVRKFASLKFFKLNLMIFEIANFL